LIGSPAIEDTAIVCGAAAGLAIATAACVAGTDAKKIRSLPHLDWPSAKDQVVIPKTHVTGFAQSFRLAGPRLVEIGGAEGPTPSEFAGAISDRTAAVTLCGGELPGNVRFPSQTSIAEAVEIAHARGVPVIVDAAAELPPPENLRRFSELGVDLVIFSGGKGLCGPQASGLILGKADLIEACRLNNNPHSSIGRPMKVGKEEIAGLLKAVEIYVARDHAADLRRWDEDVRTILDALQGLDGATTERFLARTIPQARLTIDQARAGTSAASLAAQLRDGDPRIFLTHAGNTLTVNPHNLQPGEAEHIAFRLRSLLQHAARQPALAAS
jgi:D-glucosaminate-6-phosphate ammonia-lyase